MKFNHIGGKKEIMKIPQDFGLGRHPHSFCNGKSHMIMSCNATATFQDGTTATSN
jgi:hypothetical protein